MAGRNISSEDGISTQSCMNASGCVPSVVIRGHHEADVHNGATRVPVSIPCSMCLSTLGRVVRKPVKANPGLKVNRSIDFFCIKMFFTSYFLSSLRLFKLKREGQTI